jgi:hypothetical protein
MEPKIIRLKKYGQLILVMDDLENLIYKSALTIKAEKDHLIALGNFLGIELEIVEM